MSTGAWIMLVLGAVMIYGSLAYFISVEIRKGRERVEQDRKRAQEKDFPLTEEEGCLPAEESAEERCY